MAPGGISTEVLCLQVQPFLCLAWPSHQRLSPGGQRACPLPSVGPPRLGCPADTVGGIDGRLAGAEGLRPSRQAAHDMCHPVRCPQPCPALAACKPAVLTAGLATSPSPWKPAPDSGRPARGSPGGFLGAPSGQLGRSCQLSQPETIRSFGGRSSPQLTSALPPAWGPHLAIPPRSLHPATHSGWTPSPGLGGLGGGPAAVGLSALSLLPLPDAVSPLVHGFCSLSLET